MGLALLGAGHGARAAHLGEGGGAQVLAPAYQTLDFAPPEPGTYELPPLGDAGDGRVLDTAGRALRLHDLLGERVAVLAFVYTSCPDPNGCPLANYVLVRVQSALREDPELAASVRLLTLSFDPEHDTPAVMRRYGSHLAKDGVDWRFLTTASTADLAPILDAYGQSVRRERDADGRPLGTISHVLRVVLIDRERRIRNTYSASFLHPETLLADVRTLLGEDAATRGGAARAAAAGERPAGGARAPSPALQGAGDVKRGYEDADYATASRSLGGRRGEAADLLALVERPPLGLPPVPVPADAPLNAARVALGRDLFFDRRLSGNGTMSCAMCHVPEQGFTSQEMATAVGIEGRTVRRNAPTLYNVAHAERLFHDAREDRLEQQIWGPLLASNEMGAPSVGWVLARIRALPEYRGRFEAAFDGRGPSMETLGMALASYERTLLSADSPFDRWRFGGDEKALSPAAQRGFALFTGRAGCAGCHLVGEDHALFTDHQTHDTGVGYRQAAAPTRGARRLQIAPGHFVEVAADVVGSAAETPPSDLGRYEVTRDPADRWAYRTPTLRNVALTPPYMHDGSIPTLREVVEFYAAGGVPNETLDPRVRPLDLSERDVDDLVAFLESLTGSNVETLVGDAFAARVGNP